METYNGWKNRDTWLVALWINNDEELYHLVRNFKNMFLDMPGIAIARQVQKYATDKINCKNIDTEEIHEMIREL